MSSPRVAYGSMSRLSSRSMQREVHPAREDGTWGGPFLGPLEESDWESGRSLPHSPIVSTSGSWTPESLSQLFIDLRIFLGRTQFELSVLLSTDVRVISALESGRFSDLPRWDILERIVQDYMSLLRKDSSSILRALRAFSKFSRTPDSKVAEFSEEKREEDGRGEVSFYSRGDISRRYCRHETSNDLSLGSQEDKERDDDLSWWEDLRFHLAAVSRLCCDVCARWGQKIHKGLLFGQYGRFVIFLVLAILLFQVFFPRVFSIFVSSRTSGAVLHSASPPPRQQVPVQRNNFRWINVDNPRSRRSDKLEIRR